MSASAWGSDSKLQAAILLLCSLSYPAASIDPQRSVFSIPNKPIRTVLRWQVVVTLLFAAGAAYFAGMRGLWSALLGGAVSVLAGLAFAWIVARNTARTAAGTLVTAFKAEGAKVAVLAIGLWVVFATYEEVVALAFLATLFVTVLVFSMAFFVRDDTSGGDMKNGATTDGRGRDPRRDPRRDHGGADNGR